MFQYYKKNEEKHQLVLRLVPLLQSNCGVNLFTNTFFLVFQCDRITWYIVIKRALVKSLREEKTVDRFKPARLDKKHLRFVCSHFRRVYKNPQVKFDSTFRIIQSCGHNMLCHLFKLEKEGQENLNQRVSIIDKFIWVMCSMQQQVSLLFLYQLRFAQTIF